MTFTDNDNDFIVEAYRSLRPGPVDKLPYTEAFEKLHGQFQSQRRMVSKNLFWTHLLSLRKHKVYGPRMKSDPTRRQGCRSCKPPLPVMTVGEKIEQARQIIGHTGPKS
jgi:hypothetical protein